MTPRWTTRGRGWVNWLLQPLNLQLQTRTAEVAELQRLRELQEHGYFEREVFPWPLSVEADWVERIISALSTHQSELRRLLEAPTATGFMADNLFFSGPDAETLYAMIRLCRPGRIVEVGSGHSTQLLREAVTAGGLNTELVAIDPRPRIDVTGLVDRFVQVPLGMRSDLGIFRALGENDILFVDSSHEIRTGNDVAFLYLCVLPSLAPGVLVHLHDIFLPFEYPADWIFDKGRLWTEQYLLQALLSGGDAFEIVWPGHLLQRTREDFQSLFQSNQCLASSFWLRTRTGERES